MMSVQILTIDIIRYWSLYAVPLAILFFVIPCRMRIRHGRTKRRIASGTQKSDQYLMTSMVRICRANISLPIAVRGLALRL